MSQTLLLYYQTKAGSGNYKTMINPKATKITAKFTKIRRQQTPRVLGQNGLGADMVSTTTPALVDPLLLTLTLNSLFALDEETCDIWDRAGTICIPPGRLERDLDLVT